MSAARVTATLTPARRLQLGRRAQWLAGASVAYNLLEAAVAVASLVIMPFLSWAQRRTGRALGSGSVIADSKQTLVCTYLPAVLLAGLLLNTFLGWGWADPLAGLVIAAVALKEGHEAWRGETCGCAPSMNDQPVHVGDALRGTARATISARDTDPRPGSLVERSLLDISKKDR